ncbi:MULTISPECIES: hypothetical protein [Streptomyces]|uniref:hypothetical protein n=1 Tax=Streptomyces TaxID=1883 RepID=UPI000CD58FB3|nr:MULTISPECIES: hypothetical protein [Streptomyces]
MSEEVKLSPEEATRVQNIIDQAFEEMETVSREVAANAGQVSAAYQGGGTAQAGENYEGLGRFGGLLAETLNGLAADLNVTVNTGVETDSQAESLIRNAGGGGGADAGIAAAI